LAENILKVHKQEISQFVIVPSDGGRFEVKVDGNLVFSKLEEGRFPEDEEILAHL
jgi:selenoprotein W-related protein